MLSRRRNFGTGRTWNVGMPKIRIEIAICRFAAVKKLGTSIIDVASQRAELSKTLAAPSPTFANEPRSSATKIITVYAATCPIARERKGIRKEPGYAK
ncbi:hypothetical protein PVK06_049918 [Gossypium arboreum]|uniref:Uncharacterized protein n=1 Tax=Gossypium arboreum TaxID=29729 RepID=A0ABR0M9U8_GOSAR|nr:hypothetical protein PVK06_049918 [Gossypium arboreum]